MHNSTSFFILSICIVLNKNRKSSRLIDMYYANFLTKLVKRNFKFHDPNSQLLIGNIEDNDVVKEIKEPSYVDRQQKLI